MNNISSFKTFNHLPLLPKNDYSQQLNSDNSSGLFFGTTFNPKKILLSLEHMRLIKILLDRDLLQNYKFTLHEDDYDHPMPIPFVYIETLKDNLDVEELTIKRKPFLSKLDKYHLLAGAFAGVIARSFTAPFDRLKILYQVMYSNSETKAPKMIHGLRQIYNNEGITGLFRGNLVNVIKACPDTMLKFYFFEKFKVYFQGEDPHLSLKKTFYAGTSAGIFSYTLIFPMDVIKTKLCGSPKGTYHGLFDAIKKIYQNEGIPGYYRGLKISVSSVVPAIGLNLTIYETLKKAYSKHVNPHSTPTYLYMLFGGFSSLASSAMMYPTQVLQTRIIMNDVTKSYKKCSIFNIVSTIIKKEGAMGFYKGFAPAISKLILGNAITFGAYEKSKQYLIEKNWFDEHN